LPKAWIQDRKRDYYYKKAKEEQKRSRAYYKLFQAATKYHFIRYRDIVVDLGAAPGGWIQAARRIVGSKGFVLGIDLKPIEPFSQENVRTILGDMTDDSIVQRIQEFLPRKANVVVSDASQNISGIWEVDHARQVDLARNALNIARQLLCPCGNFFVKVFQGDLLGDFTQNVKQKFETVKVIKPEASRTKSSELFVLGLCLKQQS
jgi:23S rRNA (uridine2552-2'-O)-methyltransferase